MADPTRAAVPIDDWAFRYGWGAFETIRVLKRRPLFLQQHLDRMTQTAQALHLPGIATTDRWRKEIYKTIATARLSNGSLNLYWTLGTPPHFSGRRIVCARPGRASIARPLRLWLAPWRIDPTTPGVGAKTMAYFPNIFASACALHEDCDEALILNSSGRIADCATSSVFVVEGERIATPSLPEGALSGITRTLVLSLASELGIPARECRITKAGIETADAVLVTSSLRGIALVRTIAGTRLPALSASTANRIVKSLRTGYQRLLAEQMDSTDAAF